MSKKLMSIGEYAKMVGVSPEYLKFYDKKDLIKPVWKDDRSYRYYADFQIVHFMELQQLSNMGISLEDAKEIIHEYSLKDRLQVYKDAYKKKQDELEQLVFLMHQMEDTTDALERVYEKESWRIVEIPECYFVYVKDIGSDRNSAFWKDSFSMNATRYIKMKNPESYAFIDGEYDTVWGAIQPKLVENITGDSRNQIIALGNCKCFVYEYSVKSQYDDEGKLGDSVWDETLKFSLLQ